MQYLTQDDLDALYQRPLLEQLIGSNYDLLSIKEEEALAKVRSELSHIYNIDETLTLIPRRALLVRWVGVLTIYHTMLRLHPSQVSAHWRDAYLEACDAMRMAGTGKTTLDWPRVEGKDADVSGLQYGSRFESRHLDWPM
jgi:hypothetical protein